MMFTFAQLDEIRAHALRLAAGNDVPLTEMLAQVGKATMDARLGLRQRLMADGLVREYVRRLSLPNCRNVEGWQALAECRYVQLLLTFVGEPGGPVLLEGSQQTVLESDLPVALAHILGPLGMAQCYLWSSDIHDHVRRSPELPRHIISRNLLPFPVMFWSRETACETGSGDAETNWMLLVDEGADLGCNVWIDLSRSPSSMSITGGHIAYGRVWPDDFAHLTDAEREANAYVLKCLAFLASPYVEVKGERIPRAFRRRMENAGPRHDPLVHVVTLRRRQEALKEAQGEDGARAFRHHWWVAGHFRAQWYPSEQAHKVIWIAPHLKGPLDKPLLEKVYAVSR